MLSQVSLLLRTLLHEQRRCQRKRLEQLNPPSREKTPSAGNWTKFLLDALKSVLGLINGPIEGMQLRPEELERMSKHISSTVAHLCSIFQVISLDQSKEIFFVDFSKASRKKTKTIFFINQAINRPSQALRPGK
jgi:hypothetical protein